jgi:hypothetical protein
MMHSNSSFDTLLFSEKLNIPTRQWKHQNSQNLLESNPITIVCNSVYVDLDNS